MNIIANFRDYEHGATKGFADLIINGSIAINGATLVEGKNGYFVGLPDIEVNGEYREVISGVSREFADQMLDAVLKARDSAEKKASVGKGGDGHYDVHVGAIDNPRGVTKAMASFTVSESIDSEKSSFTINSIRVNQGRNGLFVGMPDRKTGNDDYPYEKICAFIGDSKNYFEGLIVGAAMEKTGLNRKVALEDRMKEAAEKSAEKTLDELSGREPVHAGGSLAR
ncbi:MAG: septation protein SpoVG family protein [Anaerovoracaceae bacterium]